MRKATRVLSALMVIPLAAAAHHSRFEFSDEVIELEGQVVDIIWRNPHPEFTMQVSSEGGATERWQVQIFTSVRGLQRMGVDPDLLQVGANIRLAGSPSTRAENYMLGTNVLRTDGLELVLGRRFGPVWTDNYVGGSEADTIDESTVVDAASEDRGIFRVWTLANRLVFHRTRPFSEQALAIAAQVDPHDTPVVRCEQPGMPVPMMQPTQFAFVDDGPVISLHHEYFNTVRTIHMVGVTNPSTQPMTPLGYSVGRWENNTLVVETTRINWHEHDIRGHPQSEQVSIVERFTLREDQTTLDYRMVITDPVYLTEPAVYERSWHALGRDLETFLCDRI